jgi:hypothetical protein
MGITRSWSAADHFVTLNGQIVGEFPDGDAVSVTLTDDDTMIVQGANGSAAICYKHNKILEITVNLLQTSYDNDRLQVLADELLEARRGSIAIEVRDGRGETVFSCPQAAIKKRPDYTMATEAGSVAWVFHGKAELFKISGNESA